MSGLVDRIRSMSRRPASLGAARGNAISLAMGEPFAPTPAAVVEAAVSGLRHGMTRYEQLTGSPTLREALADHFSSGGNRSVKPGEVVITHGASAGLAATILSLIGPGDRVLIPEPTYSLYVDHVAMAGGEVVWIPHRADGGLDLQRVEDEMPHARLVVLCNPSNPTGHVLSDSEMSVLAGLAARTGCHLLFDEAYSDIVYDGVVFRSGLGLEEVADLVVCCGTFSKTYAMTGWRVGHVIAPEPLAAAINLTHRTINGAVNTFVQHAAHTALDLHRELVPELVRAYQLRRDLVLAELATLPGVTTTRPSGAFYAFPRVHSDLTSDQLTARLADAGVLVRSGAEYGPSGEGHIRISYAADLEFLHEGLRRLTAVLAITTRRDTT